MTMLPRAALLLVLLTSGACAPIYMGKSETLRADAFKSEPGWTSVEGVPELRQKTALDCGPVALSMVTRYWSRASGAESDLPVMERVSAGDLRDAAKSQGYQAFLVEGTLTDIEHELQAQRPMIVGMAKPTTDGALGHYEVVVGLNRKRQLIATLDPALGRRQYSFEAFLHEWIRAGRPMLVLIPPRAPGGDSVLESVAGLEDPGDHGEAHGGKP